MMEWFRFSEKKPNKLDMVIAVLKSKEYVIGCLEEEDGVEYFRAQLFNNAYRLNTKKVKIWSRIRIPLELGCEVFGLEAAQSQ